MQVYPLRTSEGQAFAFFFRSVRKLLSVCGDRTVGNVEEATCFSSFTRLKITVKPSPALGSDSSHAPNLGIEAALLCCRSKKTTINLILSIMVWLPQKTYRFIGWLSCSGLPSTPLRSTCIVGTALIASRLGRDAATRIFPHVPSNPMLLHRDRRLIGTVDLRASCTEHEGSGVVFGVIRVNPYCPSVLFFSCILEECCVGDVVVVPVAKFWDMRRLLLLQIHVHKEEEEEDDDDFIFK